MIKNALASSAVVMMLSGSAFAQSGNEHPLFFPLHVHCFELVLSMRFASDPSSANDFRSPEADAEVIEPFSYFDVWSKLYSFQSTINIAQDLGVLTGEQENVSNQMIAEAWTATRSAVGNATRFEQLSSDIETLNAVGNRYFESCEIFIHNYHNQFD